jgi:uncharacterized cupin superfamily protein
MIAHWDEVDDVTIERGHLRARWTRLGEAIGSRGVGLRRIRVAPGGWATPAHVHGADEEIFYVLAGDGLSWQDGATHRIGPGDCLVHAPEGAAHTLMGGDGGLDVLAFGGRAQDASTLLPRAGVMWLGARWVDAGEDPRPWDREVAAGPPPVGEPSPRPASIVNVADAPTFFDGQVQAVGRAAGAERAGLNRVTLPAGREGAPPHCHSAEEEIFVVLEGSATLVLTPSPARRAAGVDDEAHELRAGHVVSRPPGTGIAHHLVAGPGGVTYLAYGTRDTTDITYYPRSNKFFLRGIGLIGRVEPLAFMDGET